MKYTCGIAVQAILTWQSLVRQAVAVKQIGRAMRKSLNLFFLLCVLAVAGHFLFEKSSSAFADDDTPAASADIADIYRRVIPSVVSIEVRSGFFRSGNGTGFVVDDKGHIVTNAHVIEDASNIRVIFLDELETQAELIGIDRLADIAVIKVDVETDNLIPVSFGDSDELAIGQSVLAIGNPHGLAGSLTRGIISGLRREIEIDDGSIMKSMIQTDAAINPGNSGGPLFNLAGEAVGVNTAGYRSANNLGFAIPSNRVKRISKNMIAGKQFRITVTPWPTLTSWPTLTPWPTLNQPEVAKPMATPTLDTGAPVPTDTDTPVPTDADRPMPRMTITSKPPVSTDCPTTPVVFTHGGAGVSLRHLQDGAGHSPVFYQDSAGISLDVIGIDSTNLSQVAINASGQLVSGLDVDNFSVGGDLEDLATVTGVENITDDDLAFASVLVIDTSSSMADRPMREAKRAAARYVMSLRPNDPVAIVTFSTIASLIVDYTTDRDLLLRAIDSLAYGGQTALYDATHLGIEIASRAPSPRRAVVILSDGGEYGDISEHGRDESVKAATVNGVPVYTVGLGWSRSIDRRFLELISSETNAEFFFSPTLEQLVAIYQQLADLFRRQYIITLEATVPADGTRYNFTLEVLTADGRGASGAATLRAPIPIPLVFLPDELFTEALRESTQIQVEILADQEIESIEIALDGEVVSTDETFTIEPEEAEPGEHRLDITVSDVEGDVGSLSAEFEVAALPPTVADDFDPAALADSRTAEVITVDAGGQTEITQVEFFIDDELYQVDDEAPYELNLDPFDLLPGEHTLSVRASNAGGQSTTVDRQFDVDVIAPRLEIEGVAEDTVISDSVIGRVLASGQSPITSISTEPGLAVVVEDNRMQFTLNAAELPPGKNTIAVRAVDAAGAEIVQTLEFEVAALPPIVALSGVAIDGILQGAQDVAVQAGGQTDITQIEVAFDDGPREVIRDESFTIPAEELGDGEHEVEVTVRNAGGESTTVRLPFTIALPRSS